MSFENDSYRDNFSRGEDTTDSCRVDYNSSTYASSPKYFRSVERCVEDGINNKPGMARCVQQHNTIYLTIEPQLYHPVEVCYLEEKEILKTCTNWPMYMQPTSQELAEAGFYYLGNADRVCCFCCGVTLRNWKLTDNAISEHKRHAPHCLFPHIHQWRRSNRCSSAINATRNGQYTSFNDELSTRKDLLLQRGFQSSFSFEHGSRLQSEFERNFGYSKSLGLRLDGCQTSPIFEGYDIFVLRPVR